MPERQQLGNPGPSEQAEPASSAAVAEMVADVIDGRDVREALEGAADQIDMDIEDNQGYPPFGE